MFVRKLADETPDLSIFGENGLYQVKQEVPFSLKERICLLILALGFLAPISVLGGRFILPEVAMLLFLFATKRLSYVFSKVYLFLFVFYVPLIVELIMPVAYFPLKRNILLCSKLTIFIFFLFMFVNRCRNPQNAVWVCKKIIMPLSIVLTLSFMIDQVTSNTFFTTWHELLATKSQAFFDSFSDLFTMDSYLGSGFLTRVSDVPPWCFMGIVSVFWLYGANLLKKSRMVILLILFVFAALVVPKRSAVIVLMASSLIFVFVGGWRIKRHVSLLLITALLLSFIGAQYLVNQLMQVGVIKSMDLAGGYNRLLEAGLGQTGSKYDDRIVLGLAQIEYLIHHPRHLLFGAGWDFASAVWIKPHSTVLAILAGGGIWGILTIIGGYKMLFRYSRNLQQPQMKIRIYLFSLITLLLYNISDSSFFFAIEYPGSLFVLWMAWTVILYGVPMPYRPRKWFRSQVKIINDRSPGFTSISLERPHV